MNEYETLVKQLNLKKHPEGGFFRETYRSKEIIPKKALPKRFNGDRSFSTGIYYLLCKDDFSAFHRIKQDELWHFYGGTSLIIHVIDTEGVYSLVKLGRDLSEGESLQTIINAGCFFAAEVRDKNSFSLVGCTVAPGFDFQDLEILKREELIGLFPKHEALIKRFTRGKYSQKLGSSEKDKDED